MSLNFLNLFGIFPVYFYKLQSGQSIQTYIQNFLSDAGTDGKALVIKKEQNFPPTSVNQNEAVQIKPMKNRRNRNINRESFSIEFWMIITPHTVTRPIWLYFHRSWQAENTNQIFSWTVGDSWRYVSPGKISKCRRSR